ncbi:MAG: GAF domain-containing protein, partial [candidate division WOR-3 bacterium]
TTTDEVLKTVFREAFRFVGHTTGLVIAVEPGHRFRIVDSEGVTEAHKAAFHNRSPQESFGSFDWVVQTGRIFESRDTKKAVAKGSMMDLDLPMPKQVTNIPLKCGGQVVGILVLDTVASDKQVRSALLALADIAGIALEKARALEHSRQQSEALRKVVEAIGSAADPLPIILGEAVKLFSAEYGFFAFVDPVAKQVSPRVFWEGGHLLAGEQIPEDKRSRSWDEGITGFVARTGTPYRTGNAPEDPLYVKWYATTRSELAVPLKDTSGQTIGVLNLESSRADAFSPAEESLCQHLANVAAAAIEKARLFEQMQQLNAQLENLHRVVQEQTSDEALDRALEGINAILGEGTSSSINPYDAQSGIFDPSAYRAAGPLRDYLLQVPPRATDGGGTGRYVVDTGQPLYLDDVLNPPPGCPTIREESIEREVKSFAALPLRAREQIIGALFVNVQRRVFFTPELRRSLELFAKQAAIAIENARLFEQLDRRVRELEVLTEMSRAAVSTLGLDQILDLVYEQTAKIMDLGDALFYIAFYDEAKDEVSFGLAVEQDDGKEIDRVRWGRRDGEAVQAWMPRSRQKRFGLTEYVIHNKQPVLIAENFEEWARREFRAEVWPGIGRRQRPTLSWLGVPMMVGGRVIGMISIQSLEQERAFDQGDRELLSTVANQAAVAIENARLYATLETNVRQLELIQKIALEISSKLDLLEVLRAIALGTNQVLEADFTTIFPYDPERGFEEGIRVGVFDGKPSTPSRNGWGAQIMKEGKPVIVEDADKEPQLKREFLERSRVRSFVGCPIQFANQSVGLMFVNFVKHHAFTKSEIEWIGYLASQAAVAIQNAKNFAKVREIERMQAADLMAADFLHRLGNYLGSIPPRLQMIQEHISSPVEHTPVEIKGEL